MLIFIGAYIHGCLYSWVLIFKGAYKHMYTNSSKSLPTASGYSWGGTRLVMQTTLDLDLNLGLMPLLEMLSHNQSCWCYARLTQHMSSQDPRRENCHVLPSTRGMTAHQTSALGAVQCQTHTLRQSGSSS